MNRAECNAFREFRQGFVPKGHATIARGFNAGTGREENAESQRDGCAGLPVVPEFQPSLRDSIQRDSNPGLETPGYFHLSFRTRDGESPKGIRAGAV